MLFLWMGLFSPAHAETITLSVPGPGNMAFLPVYLAKAIGADHDEGLELKLRYFNGGPLAMRDLMAKNSDFSVLGLSVVAAARADDQPVVAIGQLSQSAMFVFLLRADLQGKISTLAQLKGKRIGTPTGTGHQRSLGQMMAEHLLLGAGLKLNDVQFISTGLNRESQHAAFSSATIDAMMADEPFASEMIAQGLAVRLADLYNQKKSNELLGGSIVRAALVTRAEVYAMHPATVKKVRRMFSRALLWLSGHSSQEIADQLASQPGFDASRNRLLVDVLQRGHGMFPNRLEWDAQAVANTEQFFHQMSGNPADAQLRFSDFILKLPEN